MKNFNKIFVLVLLLALSLSITSISYAKTEIKFWTNWSTTDNKAFAEELIKAFEKENSDIKVVHRAIPNDQMYQTIRTGLAGDNPPDIFQHDGYQQTRDFAKAGLAMDLSEWWNQYGDRFIPAAKGSNNLYKGKVYAFPWDMVVLNQIFYNVKMLRDIGVTEPPETWKEFVNIMDKFKEKGISPIALGNKAGWPGMHWFQQFILQTAGAEKINAIASRNEPNTTPKWTDPQIIEGVKYYEKLADEGYFSPGAASSDYQLASSYFMAQKAPFFHTGSWFIGSDFPPNLEWDIFEFPRIQSAEYGPNHKDMTISFLGNFSVAEKSKNKESALRFLEFMARPEWGGRWIEVSAQFSTLKGALTEDNNNEKLAYIMKMTEKATGSITFLEGNLPASVGEDKIYNGGIAVVANEMTAEEWMKSVEDEQQNVLNK